MALLTLKMEERGQEAKNAGDLEQARKCVVPWSHQKEHHLAIALILAQANPQQTYDRHTYQKAHFFKLLNLWSFVNSTNRKLMQDCSRNQEHTIPMPFADPCGLG